MIDLRNLRVCGYAITFNEVIAFGDELEMVDAGAFASSLARPAYLNAIWHEAEPLADIEFLFADRHGLGFRTAPFDCTWSGLPQSMTHGFDGVSIGGIDITSSDYVPVYGRSVRRILGATVRHVCLTDQPAYPGTAAWIEGQDLSFAPSRIRQSAARWRLGHSNALLAQSSAAARRRRDEEIRAQKLEARYQARMSAARRPPPAPSRATAARTSLEERAAARQRERLLKFGAAR